jgi:hypothetical protein
MQFLPTLELTPQLRLLLARGALRLQPGQWVRDERGVGRYLRTDTEKGVTYVSRVRPGDTWASASDRFRRACVKGFVGKYRGRYERTKAERRARRGDGGPPADPSSGTPVPEGWNGGLYSAAAR